MSDAVITVENLSKAYLLGHQEKSDTFFGAIASTIKSPLKNLRQLNRLNTFNLDKTGEADEDILWALRDVSFEVKRGEVLGIIGRNGAGKSTLLKILSRIAHPTGGRVEIRGRVSALLEVGTGFHPELTGRDNIYMNGTILGMRKAEIDAKFDEIVDFSGVERFLDTPVKRYSSGMTVRLAFSVAAHLEPEILIVDEVLAVGDAEFQKKCLGKMQDVSKGNGRTVLFVSHQMGAVSELCGRCLLLDRGGVIDSGKPSMIVKQYLSAGSVSGKIDLVNYSSGRTGDGPMRVSSIATSGPDGNMKSLFKYGESMSYIIEIDSEGPRNIIFGISVRNNTGQVVFHFNNTDDNKILKVHPGKNKLIIELKDLILNDGDYQVTAWLGDSMNILHDRVGDCLGFKVETPSSNIRSVGSVRVPVQWSIVR